MPPNQALPLAAFWYKVVGRVRSHLALASPLARPPAENSSPVLSFPDERHE